MDRFINGELPYMDNLFLVYIVPIQVTLGNVHLVNRRYAEAVIVRNA